MKSHQDPIDSLIDRVDELDAASRANLIARLARERHLLGTLMNTLREGILVVEASGRLQYANPSSMEMLGIHERDVGDLILWRAVPDLARTLKISKKGYLVEESNVSRELELNYPHRRVVRMYLVPIEEPLKDVQLARYAVILADITSEREQTRQEIQDERIKSILELAAGVAHELGNPLNSLTIHLQVMRRQLKKLGDSPEILKLQKSLDICSGEVERLDSIITHFLEAVRPKKPNLHDLDLLSPLEESIEFLGPELESAGIRVDIELAASLPLVQGDRNQIKQVFFNIIKNARQAMKSGGIIRIRAFADD